MDRRFVRFVSVTFVASSMAAAAVATGGLAQAAQAPVGLGAAASFAVLAGTTVTNTGPSTIGGAVGVSPGTAVTGFPPGTVSNGAIHAADVAAGQAQAAVTTAYIDAAGRSSSGTVSADLGGQTLIPGVYTGGALALNGTLTLNAQGNPSAVFVFQGASSLITGSGSRVVLTGGATACNVFWQVGSSATLGTNSVFVGTVLALTSVSATTGASVSGRLLARNGAVTLDSNAVATPVCGAVAPTGTATATASVSATGTATTAATTPSPAATTTRTATAAPTAGPALPFTGAPISAVALVGVLVLSVGVFVLVMVSRRRRGY
jgi:Ice-binding-like